MFLIVPSLNAPSMQSYKIQYSHHKHSHTGILTYFLTAYLLTWLNLVVAFRSTLHMWPVESENIVYFMRLAHFPLVTSTYPSKSVICLQCSCNRARKPSDVMPRKHLFMWKSYLQNYGTIGVIFRFTPIVSVTPNGMNSHNTFHL